MYIYIYTYMTKVISISDEAYNRLFKLKRGKDSFSDVVIKMTEKEKKKSLLEYAGIWKDDKEIGDIFKKIEEERHQAKTRDYKL
jgi:predicted CopG family antitoxin